MNLLLDGAMDIRRPGHAWPRLSGLSHNRRARAIALHWPGMARAVRRGRAGWAGQAALSWRDWFGGARPAGQRGGGLVAGKEARRQQGKRLRQPYKWG